MQRFIFDIKNLIEYNKRYNFGSAFITGVSTVYNPQNNTLLYATLKGWKDDLFYTLKGLKNCIIIVEQGIDFDENLNNFNYIIIVDNARLEYAKILRFILNTSYKRKKYTKRNDEIITGENVSIGKNVIIEPFVFIDHDVSIEDNTILKTGCKIRQYVNIGKNVIIGENTVIGAQGFGIEKDNDGQMIRIPHLGGVIINDNVEIGALSSIVSGTIEPTIIESNVMIDDLNQVAHNCKIGKGTLTTACAQMSGSVIIGEDSYLAPNCTIRDGITLGKNCFVGQGSTVIKDIPDGAIVIGNPARMLNK